MTANISDLPVDAIQSDEMYNLHAYIRFILTAYSITRDELEFHQLRMEGEWKPNSTFYLCTLVAESLITFTLVN